jgi:hypothetical protein
MKAALRKYPKPKAKKWKALLRRIRVSRKIKAIP